MKRRSRAALTVALVLCASAGTLAVRGALPDASGWSFSDDAATAAQRQETKERSVTSAVSSTGLRTAFGCPIRGHVVHSASQLQRALGSAKAGDVIRLAPGTYRGQFIAHSSGTRAKPIFLCGTTRSILDGGGPKDGYVLHLDGADYWRVGGFVVRNGQKGVVADGTSNTIIQALTVSDIGDEAIHLRTFSTRNLVIGNRVRHTGLRKPKFGEGIYIGTAKSNWCSLTNCRPDASDANRIVGNVITGTTAESVDIKEGTTGGTLSGNRFNGASIQPAGADSWVDVKGNSWTIVGNSGVDSPKDGFQTHEILEGWGRGNRFQSNRADLGSGGGLGFALQPPLNNVLRCSNRVSGGNEGLSNVHCRR